MKALTVYNQRLFSCTWRILRGRNALTQQISFHSLIFAAEHPKRQIGHFVVE